MSKKNTTADAIAIVGMAAMYPKSPDLKGFWHLIRAGVDGITEIPQTHWRPEDYFDANQKAPDKTYCQRGGFLPAHRFDPTEFSLPPTVLEATDTSQLLGLVVAKAALEDAGYGANKEFKRDTTSVILGVTGTLELVVPLGARLGHPIWRKALVESGLAPELVEEVMGRISEGYVPWQENSFPGLLGNVVAGRIANRLDLHGTNCVVDAACASSLSAAHLAIMELSTGKADMVITGGADTFNDIFMYMCFSKTPALSASGKIRPFAEASDGTLIGEGLGMVVLKRLSDAKADGDRIYAVVKGVGTASDGNSGAVYAPDSKGQARALRDAYERAGVSPSQIRLVEAHGTGTKVGDVVEFEGLRSVYAPASGDRKGYVALGTVKSQVGHTKAAAGSASLIKAALALYYKVYPPTLGVEKPNPKINLEDSPFYINNEARPWVSEPGQPRRAALSSFGFGGSNFHMVLEEAQADRPEVAWDGSVRIWAECNTTPALLAQSLKDAAARLSDEPNEQARLAHQRSAEFDFKAGARCVIVWNTEKSLKELLLQAAQQVHDGKASDGPEIFYAPGVEAGKVVFMFPGQGSQYVNMGRELACVFPEVLESIERSDLHSPKGEPLSAKMYPPPTFNDDLKKTREEALTATNAAQPALGALNRGIYEILSQRFGLTPDFTCGHSYGELCALYAAGVYDADSLCKVSFLRGELMAQGDGGRGAMAAVTAPLEKVEALLPELKDVVIANRNSPGQCVLSGSKEAVKEATARLKEHGMRAIPLQVGAAFHSPLVASAEAPFRKGLDEVKFGKASLPVLANKTAQDYPTEAKKMKDLLANQLVSQVNWVSQVEELYQRGARTFVEVGPKNVLSKLVGAILKGKDFKAVALDGSTGRNGLSDLAQGLAQLAALGLPVHLGQWETAPAEGRKRKMTVELTGANYRSPQSKKSTNVRPAGSVNVLPPAGSPPVVVSTSAPAPVAVAPKPAAPAPAPQPVAPQPVAPVVRQPAASPEAVQQVQASMLAIQALQQQAAQAHHRFLETQETTMKTFQALVQNQQSLMMRLQSGQAPPSLQAPAPVASPAPRPAPVAPAPAPTPAVQAAPVAPKPVVTPKPVAAPQPVVAPAPVTPAPSAVKPQPAVGHAVMAVVADKTGYPVEMLNLEMDLEADLGIDSIKRVEILAAVQEKMPQLAAVPSDQMGSLRTLREVVNAFGVSDGPVATTAASAPAPAPGVSKALLEVVADKTGYPVEMLNLEMDLEADLGIDSIKRVEILAAIEEKVPGLPKVASDQMGSLRTLGQIVSAFGAVAAAPAAPAASAPAPGVSKALLEVVAEKTGYPMEMLNLEMDLEADLGIDSIKRVEILAAIEEKVPGLPKVASDQMGSLRTLGQIVSAFGATTAPAPVAASAAPAVSSDILAIVAEKTGYPVDMLNLDMDLESDLGVDSIKRVEILASIPEASNIPADQVGSMRTLRQIVNALGGPTTPAQAPAPVPQSSLNTGTLLAIVAEKTGYPVEMLNLDMDLEADLGVDSIKRVEILAAVPEASALPADRVGSLRTLRQIVEAIGVPASAPAPAPAQTPTASPSKLERRILLATALPPLSNGKPFPLSKGAKVMVFSNGGSLAAALEKELKELGLNLVKEPTGDLAGLFLVESPLRESFQTVRSAAAALRGQKGLLVSIARLDGRFGLTGHFPAAESGALTGLPKTAAHEWPEVTCRAFDVDNAFRDDKTAAKKLIQEISHGGPLELGLTAGQRFALETPLEEVTVTKPIFKKGDVVLVTGGARGVTAATVIALARSCQPSLVLLGRSPLPAEEPAWARGLSQDGALKKAILQHEFNGKASPKDVEARFRSLQAQREVHGTLEAIRKAGARVEYRSVDVRDQQAVSNMISEISSSIGPVQGIVHGAGVLADKKIEEKTDEMFDSVFSTKITGLKHLLQPLKDAKLKAIVLFSSVTARFGRPGQVDYCMANDLLNKTAQLEAQRRPGCRVVSLNWGPWGGGMVTEGLKKEFQRLGVGLIELEAGAEAMVRELSAAPGGAVEILYGDGFPAPPGSDKPSGGLLQVVASVEEFPCLESHQVGGRPVVPVALQIEWFAQAATAAQVGQRFRGLRQLQILRPISLENGDVNLHVVQNGEMFELRNTQTGQVHSRALVDLGSELPEAPSLASVNGLAQQTYPHSNPAIYETQLFHGPHFHAVKNVRGWSSHGIVAQVGTLPKVSDWIKQPLRSDWLADPLAVDAALQLGILWGIEALGKPSLPMVVGGYQQFQRKFPRGGVEARLWVEKSTPSKIVASVDFVDNQGALVARLSDVEWTADASLKQAFTKEAASSPR